MEEIVEVVDNIIIYYSKIIKNFSDINNYKINLSKNRIKHIYSKDIIKYIKFYHSFLSDKITCSDNYLMRVNKFRIKNMNSIIDKIDRYLSNYLKGNQEISKSLNDILGFRLYIDNSYNYYELYNQLISFYRDNSYIKNIIVSKKGNYLAIHIYFKIDNYNFPCELQLWRFKDIEKNEVSHKMYKQEYTNNENIEGGAL